MATTRMQAAGVTPHLEHEALQRLVQHIRPTWPTHGIGRVALDIGYFANVIDLGGLGLAITADGVGTKVMIAQMMQTYHTIGIDCVAMNVNDLLCVGATPLSLVDYLALETLNPDVIEAIAEGLAKGAQDAHISIAGGELAQLSDIITGHTAGLGFDLAGMAIGTVALDHMIIGQQIEDGDVVMGIASNGIHSNGLSLARHVLLGTDARALTEVHPDLGCSLGEELLKPTHIYVNEVLEILQRGIHVKALIHITGDGLLNLTRVQSKASYVLDHLPSPPAIFSLIQQTGKIEPEDMFRVYNMGIGFCLVVPERELDQVRAIIQAHHKDTHTIGYAKADGMAQVAIPAAGLIGKGKTFRNIHP